MKLQSLVNSFTSTHKRRSDLSLALRQEFVNSNPVPGQYLSFSICTLRKQMASL